MKTLYESILGKTYSGASNSMMWLYNLLNDVLERGKSPLIKNFEMTEKERTDLINFIKKYGEPVEMHSDPWSSDIEDTEVYAMMHTKALIKLVFVNRLQPNHVRQAIVHTVARPKKHISVDFGGFYSVENPFGSKNQTSHKISFSIRSPKDQVYKMPDDLSETLKYFENKFRS
jgi:hypothetical protein